MNALNVLKMPSWSMDLAFQLTVLRSITSSMKPAVLLDQADAMTIASATAPEDAAQLEHARIVTPWSRNTPISSAQMSALHATTPATLAADPTTTTVLIVFQANTSTMVLALLATNPAKTALAPQAENALPVTTPTCCEAPIVLSHATPTTVTSTTQTRCALPVTIPARPATTPTRMVATLATAVTFWTMVFVSHLVMKMTVTPTMITSTACHALILAPSVPQSVMTNALNARPDSPYPTDIASTASASTMTTTNTTTSTAPANALPIVSATTPEDAAPMAFARTA